jgi:hypothetical protein
MRTHKGIYYFPNYRVALDYAESHGHPTDRIIRYDIGWTIQIRISGPYVGPNT